MNPHGEQNPSSRDLLILAIVYALFMVPSLFTRDLWNPDEPRYMEVGREMLALHNYLVPHLDGNIYPDKPPMFFWLAAICYKIGFGVNGGRIVALAASAGTILLTWLLARRLMRGPGPLFAALTVMTGLLFMITSRAGVIDPLLAFFTTVSIYCGLRALDLNEQRHRAFWLGCYAAAGCAILTKGPVGFIIPGLTLTAYSFAANRKVRGGGWIHLAGVALMLAIVFAWLIPALVQGGEAYRNNILFKQTAERVVHSYSHENPWYYYLANAPGVFFPWTLVLICAFGSAWLAWRRMRDPAATVALSWFVPIFVFFSCVSGKRTGYLMPLMPAFGLVMGRYFEIGSREGFPWPRLHKWFIGITAAVFVALGLASAAVFANPAAVVALVAEHSPRNLETVSDAFDFLGGMFPWAAAMAAGMIVIAAVLFIKGRRANARIEIASLAAMVLCISLVADLALLPSINEFKSGRQFAIEVEPYLAKADQIYLFKKDFSGVYNLYTGRISMPILPGPDDLRAALQRSERVAVIGRDEELFKALGNPLPIGHVAVMERVGHRKMYLLTNWNL